MADPQAPRKALAGLIQPRAAQPIGYWSPLVHRDAIANEHSILEGYSEILRQMLFTITRYISAWFLFNSIHTNRVVSPGLKNKTLMPGFDRHHRFMSCKVVAPFMLAFVMFHTFVFEARLCLDLLNWKVEPRLRSPNVVIRGFVFRSAAWMLYRSPYCQAALSLAII